MWRNMDVKFKKVYTIIVIGMMILAVKVLALFTISMGTLIFESGMFIHGWMPVRIALMTSQWLPTLVTLNPWNF